jgi:hypothetical protein
VATANIPIPPPLPTPPPLPASVAGPPPEPHSRDASVPSWATSFGVHCLAVILLGLWGYSEKMVGAPGAGEISIGWNDSDAGGGELDDDSGALPGEAEMTLDIPAPQQLAELSTATTDRFAELSNTPAELKIELPGTAKSAKTAAELSGLLGSGSGDSGPGTGAGKGAGGGPGFGKGSGAGKTEFFGIESHGNKIVYVFDRSNSMTSYDSIPLQAAKMELLSSVERLQEDQQFYAVFYNHEPRLFEPPGFSRGRPYFATSENKATFREFLYRVQGDGGTRHVSALEWAVRKKPDVIYLLTDGEEKDDLSVADLQKLTRMNSGGASIHVIQFTLESRPNSTLVQLAKRNRGKHTFIDINRLIERLSGALADPK